MVGPGAYPLTRLAVSGQDVLVVSGLGPVGLLTVAPNGPQFKEHDPDGADKLIEASGATAAHIEGCDTSIRR